MGEALAGSLFRELGRRMSNVEAPEFLAFSLQKHMLMKILCGVVRAEDRIKKIKFPVSQNSLESDCSVKVGCE